MPSSQIADLTKRTREVFRLVVEAYLEHGKPIGSKSIADSGPLDLSPASIRVVLSDLEAQGLLSAPHTSAGRIPTENGLRLFVDGMMRVTRLSKHEKAAIEEQINQAGSIEETLERTSAMLSDISGAAGMVLVPKREVTLAQLNIIPLGKKRALIVVVASDGSVENRIIEIDASMDSSLLERASNFITTKLTGRTITEAKEFMALEIGADQSQIDSRTRDLIERGLATMSEDASKRPIIIIRGQANLLNDNALRDIELVRSLIEDLEGKQSVANLLERVSKSQATRIFIGSENRLFAFSGSSVIASPYHDREGQLIGVLGVIGPTRLNYGRVIPMVDLAARSLGKLIG